jgi:hypothetical protein
MDTSLVGRVLGNAGGHLPACAQSCLPSRLYNLLSKQAATCSVSRLHLLAKQVAQYTEMAKTEHGAGGTCVTCQRYPWYPPHCQKSWLGWLHLSFYWMRPSNSNSGTRHQVNRWPIQTQRPGRLVTEFESVSNSLGGPRPSLNQMATSNKNSDAAIQARFSGSAKRCKVPHLIVKKNGGTRVPIDIL